MANALEMAPFDAPEDLHNGGNEEEMDAIENTNFNSILLAVGNLQGQQAAMLSQFAQLQSETVRLTTNLEIKHKENQQALETQRLALAHEMDSKHKDNQQAIETQRLALAADMKRYQEESDDRFEKIQEQSDRRFEKIHRIIWMGAGVLLAIQGAIALMAILKWQF